MLRRTFIALAAGSAVVLSSTAMEARPTGGIWEKTPRIRKKPKVQKEDANPPASVAPASAAAGGAPLAGLTPGLGVKTSTGAFIGTVNQVVKGADGSVQMVIITGADGKTYSLTPNQLSVANGVVIANQTGTDG